VCSVIKVSTALRHDVSYMCRLLTLKKKIQIQIQKLEDAPTRSTDDIRLKILTNLLEPSQSGVCRLRALGVRHAECTVHIYPTV